MQSPFRVRSLALFASIATICTCVACNGAESQKAAAYTVTATFPHDSNAYTQGLLWGDSALYESTGLYGHSDVRRVDLRTGRVVASRPLPADRFGEGLTLLKGRLYQLTWKAGVVYTYDPATLALQDSMKYSGEGWGLTTDGTNLIMSDGSDSLRVVSPQDFSVRRVVHVRYQNAPMHQLNELEYVNGEILANVYESNWLLRIDPETGQVKQAVDFSDLYTDRPPTAEVMNGVALAPDGQHLLLTGKLWPRLFEVKLNSDPAATAAPK
jgi:glutamine cyclotransferase